MTGKSKLIFNNFLIKISSLNKVQQCSFKNSSIKLVLLQQSLNFFSQDATERLIVVEEA